MPQPRNRASAKKAGTAHETTVANYLALTVDDRIERRAKTGAKDRGDIGGVRLSPALGGGRVVLECKDVRQLDLPGWLRETETERGNDDAIAGFVVHKAYRKADPGDQLVTGTLRDLVAVLTGQRPAELGAQST